MTMTSAPGPQDDGDCGDNDGPEHYPPFRGDNDGDNGGAESSGSDFSTGPQVHGGDYASPGDQDCNGNDAVSGSSGTAMITVLGLTTMGGDANLPRLRR